MELSQRYALGTDEIVKTLHEAFPMIEEVQDIIDKIEIACKKNKHGTNMLFTTHGNTFAIIDFESGMMITWYGELENYVDSCLDDFTLSDFKEIMKCVAQELE